MDLGDAAANAGDEALLLAHAQQDVVAALQLLSGPVPVVPGNLYSNPQVPQIFTPYHLFLAIQDDAAPGGGGGPAGGNDGTGGNQPGAAAAVVQPDPVVVDNVPPG